MVVTSLPRTSTPSTRHELTSLPSSSTLHAPQLPLLQPSLLPVKCSSSRRTSNKLWRGSQRTSVSLPLMHVCRWIFLDKGWFLIQIRSTKHEIRNNFKFQMPEIQNGNLIRRVRRLIHSSVESPRRSSSPRYSPEPASLFQLQPPRSLWCQANATSIGFPWIPCGKCESASRSPSCSAPRWPQCNWLRPIPMNERPA